MGISLTSGPAEPSWVELFSGVAFYCAPATAQTVQIAKVRADAIMVDLAAGGEAVTRVGAHILGMPDLADDDAVEGTRQTLTIISVAEIVVSDWRNVFDDAKVKKPIPFQKALLARLLSDQRVFEAFSTKCLKSVHQVFEEGNVSRHLRAGITQGAKVKTTARGAKTRARPAQRRSAGAAPTTKTRH